MSDRWLKPDFQEIGVSGECTAYAGTQQAPEKSVLTVCRQAKNRVAGEDLHSDELIAHQPDA